MPLKLFLTFDTESNRPKNHITCDHVPGAPGLHWIMDELERHGQRRVFFVNGDEHSRHPDGWMADLLRDIHRRGHEVALHCHHNPDLDFYRTSITRYDVAGQTRILRYGVDLIEAAIGAPPVAFRAGALVINRDTVLALHQANIPIDSSLLYARHRNRKDGIGSYAPVNRAARYGDVLELPVTTVDRRGRGQRGHWACLDPNVTPDGQGRWRAGFTELPRFLQANGPTVQTALFREVASGGGRRALPGPYYVPQIPDHGLPSWPAVEDCAKQDKGERAPVLGYRARPKSLVLHVGTWKTGSKALQEILAD